MSVNRKRLKKEHGMIRRVLNDVLLKIQAFFKSEESKPHHASKITTQNKVKDEDEGGEGGSGDIGRLEGSGAVSYDNLKVNYYHLMREYGELEAKAMISRHIGQDLTKEQLSELTAEQQYVLAQQNIEQKKKHLDRPRNTPKNSPSFKSTPKITPRPK